MLIYPLFRCGFALTCRRLSLFICLILCYNISVRISRGRNPEDLTGYAARRSRTANQLGNKHHDYQGSPRKRTE